MRKRHIFALLLLGLSLISCVVGAPPGFSGGDNWSVPLVAPLENDLLLVPVKINGQGPFLFMIDPDSPESSVEASLQASLKLYTRRAANRRQTEADHLNYVLIAEVNKMTIGDLSVRHLYVRVHDDATYWAGGRRVRGIIGRDVIADSLAFKFDRDEGMMYIGTQGHLKAPLDAKKVKFTQSYGIHRRYLSKVILNRKHEVTMHLDLGARTSMLWPHLIKKYKMPTIPVRATQVDEYGTKRSISSGTIAGIVKVGEIETNAITMLPYGDKRIDQDDLDGVIGQNFWSKYNVTINWHQKRVWLQKRDGNLAEKAAIRVSRWGGQLDSCKTLACLRPSLDPVVRKDAETSAAVATNVGASGSMASSGGVASQAPEEPASAEPPQAAQAPQSYTLHIERDAPGVNFAYDALLGAVDSEGKLLDLPIFLASFRSGVASLQIQGLSADYQKAARFVVLDINPVGTRGCEGDQCIYPLKNPQ